jgi:23S rRNA (uracil1939-C5)-methyltransferase
VIAVIATCPLESLVSNRWRSSISRDREPKPIEAQVLAWGDHGDGELHVGSKRLFVAGVIPGEVVSVLAAKPPKLLKVLTASDERRKAPCHYASECGGCQLQHLEPTGQLSFKADRLARFLHGLALDNLPEVELLSAEDNGYRRRARLAVSYRGGKLRMGFRQAKSNRIVNIDSCYNLTDPLNRVIRDLKPLLIQQRAISHIDLLQLDDIVGLHLRLTEQLPDHKLRGFQVLPGIALKVSLDEDWLIDTPWLVSSNGSSVAYQPGDFLQANAKINTLMVARALDWIAVEEGDSVADFFSGLGNFSVPMAVKGAAVVGFEGSDAMVRRALEAVAPAISDRIDYQTVDLFGTSLELDHYTKVLLDPPRAGAQSLCEQLSKATNVERIVYVSCDTNSLARDLRILVAGGFHIERLALADMFPNTIHSETIVLLTRVIEQG